jgi:hypothetical protein
MEEEKTFTGQSLVAALKENSFENITSNVGLTGMVKKSEKEDYISFTQSGCGTWVDLPVSMIEKAEFLEMRTCKDHAHPVMKVTLKHSGNPENEILLGLLQQTAQSVNSQKPTQFTSPQGMVGNTLNNPFSTPFNNQFNNPFNNPFNNQSNNARVQIPRGGGLGWIDCNFKCSPCTRCIPGTNYCFPSDCCDLTDCRISF